MYETPDAIAQANNIEVEQETDANISQPQVRQDLRLVNGEESFDGLQFHDNDTLDEKVEAVAKIDANTVVDHREDQFLLNNEATDPELVCQAGSICAFHEPRPEHRMYLHRGVDDLAADRIWIHAEP
jgi:hypothetical protein